MIQLSLPIDAVPFDEPIIVRLDEAGRADRTPYDVTLIRREPGIREYDCDGISLRLHAPDDMPLDGDIVFVAPGKDSAKRVLRASSQQNSFLVTEQCDQLCVMCSQPPKKHHVDLFDQFTVAAALAPRNAYITISGGEPLLHKARLFDMIEHVAEARSDVRFHVLTNGQHFEGDDFARVAQLGPDRVLWGIPLYSETASVHDEIVGKPGAFGRLLISLAGLATAGAAIELRTVVMQQNIDRMPGLARMVSAKLPFIHRWAIMQMERIGYGRMNWATSFFDTSVRFTEIERAVNIVEASGIAVSLFNFPRCTVPVDFRDLAPPTISDWKRKYLDVCDGCSERPKCTGFFEWYKETDGFKTVSALR